MPVKFVLQAVSIADFYVFGTTNPAITNCQQVRPVKPTCRMAYFIRVKSKEMLMEPKLEEYVCRPRDSKRDKELLIQLKRMPEEARFSFVRRLLQQDKRIGLLMASGSLQQKRYFQEILELGLKEGNASTILPWLECAVPKLGFSQVVLSLDNRVESEQEAVDNAVYWMPRFKPQNNPKADRVWEQLKIRRQKKVASQSQVVSADIMTRGSIKDAG